MMLIFQIAAGIVLGYIVIQYHVVLLRWLKSALSVVLTITVLGAMVWGIVSLGGTAHDWVATSPQGQRILSTLGSLALALIFLGGFAWGLFGLLLLSVEVLPIERVTNRRAGLNKFFAVIAALLYLATGVLWELPVFQGTMIGDIYWGMDEWSRSNGWADTGQMIVLTLTYQWSWIAYVVVRKLRGKPLFEDAPLAKTDSTPTEQGAEGG